MDRLRPLEELSLADAATVGGKAAALGELMRAGFRVPGGFVVGTGEIDEAEIAAAFQRLDSPLVAVRSSAAVEDGKAVSWAGQFETELNVGEDKLVESVRRCRESGRSKRAVVYSTFADHPQPLLAEGGETRKNIPVLVQAMVPADVAGVAFSMNPVTGENVVTIEAVRGLGDDLVSGRISPDPDALSVDENAEIVETVRRIESRFGYPVDVEWAIAGGVLFVLQARPITTL